MEEKRRSKRMDIDVTISLKAIENGDNSGKTYDVEVMNISKGGMAFKCDEELVIHGFYDTQITIWTKEKINTVIEVLHKDEESYGAKFVGMPAADQFKIEVYELFNYPGEEQK